MSLSLLRPLEQLKIDCGKRHFDQFGAGQFQGGEEPRRFNCVKAEENRRSPGSVLRGKRERGRKQKKQAPFHRVPSIDEMATLCNDAGPVRNHPAARFGRAVRPAVPALLRR